jgi:hypothetical protein
MGQAYARAAQSGEQTAYWSGVSPALNGKEWSEKWGY